MPRCQIVPCPMPEVHNEEVEMELCGEKFAGRIVCNRDTGHDLPHEMTYDGKWIRWPATQPAPTPDAGPMTTDDAAALKAAQVVDNWKDDWSLEGTPDTDVGESLKAHIAQAIRDAVADRDDCIAGGDHEWGFVRIQDLSVNYHSATDAMSCRNCGIYKRQWEAHLMDRARIAAREGS